MELAPYDYRLAMDHGKSQLMKLTAPIAIPTPKTMPASIRLDSPSPKANMSPPTTMATRLKPRAIGPVKAVLRTSTAFSHGDAAYTGAAPARMASTTASGIGERPRPPGLLKPAILCI